MKEHAKKALKHDTKVLGKTVPTMLIIGLFLVGGGSAAILNSFGTISGDATVTQAITFDDGDELTYSFEDQDTVAGETTTEVRGISNNADVAASYQLVAGGTEKGVDSNAYRIQDYQEASDKNFDVVRGYSGEKVTFDVSGISGDSAAIYFDSNDDGTPDFQASVTLNRDSNEFPHVQIFRNIDGTYKADTRYQDKENDDTGLSFDNSKTAINDDQPQELKDAFSGEVNENSFEIRVDVDRLGPEFRYGLKDNGGDNYRFSGGDTGFDASDDSLSESFQIGPKVETGAANDLDVGTLTRTYSNGEITFRFSNPDASPTLGVDSDNDGVYDWQLDLAASDIPDYYEWSVDDDAWSTHVEFKDSDGNPDYGTEYEGIVVQKNSESLTVTFDESKVSDVYSYDIGLGKAFLNKDSADSSQAEVVTTGVETLDAGASQDYVFANDFAINLEAENYTVSTDVVPVTQ